MGKLFSLDSPVMRFLSRMADIMILNLLVLLCCVPVITAGAAFTAMHYVLIKMIRDEETYIAKMFFKSFKENFIQATVLWIIVVVMGVIFVGDYMIFTHSDKQFPLPFVIAILAFFLFFIMTAMYVFPLQARFYNTVGRTLKNAFLFMILNFPKSLLMLILYVLPVLLFFVSPIAMPLLILFGFSLPGLGAAYLYRKVFSRFEPEAEAVTADMDFKVDMEGVETEEGEAPEDIGSSDTTEETEGSEDTEDAEDADNTTE